MDCFVEQDKKFLTQEVQKSPEFVKEMAKGFPEACLEGLRIDYSLIFTTNPTIADTLSKDPEAIASIIKGLGNQKFSLEYLNDFLKCKPIADAILQSDGLLAAVQSEILRHQDNPRLDIYAGKLPEGIFEFNNAANSRAAQRL